jgi:hypothetical protein
MIRRLHALGTSSTAAVGAALLSLCASIVLTRRRLWGLAFALLTWLFAYGAFALHEHAWREHLDSLPN